MVSLYIFWVKNWALGSLLMVELAWSVWSFCSQVKTWKRNSPYILSTRVFHWKSQHASPNWSLARSSWLHFWAYWCHDTDHIGPSQNVRLEQCVWNWFAHNEKFNAEVASPLEPETSSGFFLIVFKCQISALDCSVKKQ